MRVCVCVQGWAGELSAVCARQQVEVGRGGDGCSLCECVHQHAGSRAGRGPFLVCVYVCMFVGGHTHDSGGSHSSVMSVRMWAQVHMYGQVCVYVYAKNVT